jgi:hypothetical protein
MDEVGIMIAWWHSDFALFYDFQRSSQAEDEHAPTRSVKSRIGRRRIDGDHFYRYWSVALVEAKSCRASELTSVLVRIPLHQSSQQVFTNA